ncbi:Uncharacterised protein [Actinomyces denticolens]|nr:Uncharacterised protein [Actinomyces denticolens]
MRLLKTHHDVEDLNDGPHSTRPAGWGWIVLGAAAGLLDDLLDGHAGGVPEVADDDQGGHDHGQVRSWWSPPVVPRPSPRSTMTLTAMINRPSRDNNLFTKPGTIQDPIPSVRSQVSARSTTRPSRPPRAPHYWAMCAPTWPTEPQHLRRADRSGGISRLRAKRRGGMRRPAGTSRGHRGDLARLGGADLHGPPDPLLDAQREPTGTGTARRSPPPSSSYGWRSATSRTNEPTNGSRKRAKNTGKPAKDRRQALQGPPRRRPDQARRQIPQEPPIVTDVLRQNCHPNSETSHSILSDQGRTKSPGVRITRLTPVHAPQNPTALPSCPQNLGSPGAIKCPSVLSREDHDRGQQVASVAVPSS